jgi:hypothetical protein
MLLVNHSTYDYNLELMISSHAVRMIEFEIDLCKMLHHRF